MGATMKPCAHRHCKKLFTSSRWDRKYCSEWCAFDENAMSRKLPQGPCKQDRASWYKRRFWRIKRILEDQMWRADGIGLSHTNLYSAGNLQKATPNQLIRRVNDICGGRVGYVGYR